MVNSYNISSSFIISTRASVSNTSYYIKDFSLFVHCGVTASGQLMKIYMTL